MGAVLSGSANPHLALRLREKRRSSLDGARSAAASITKDMKKLTTAAAKLKLKSKPVKIVNSTSADAVLADKKEQLQQIRTKPEPLPAPVIKRETRSGYRLSDLCISLGHFVHKNSGHTSTPTEVVQWIRLADRSLQMNGWTLSSFICESHVVFTYMLMHKALEMFECKDGLDVKQLFFICLYISYTYNANEISYPLKPFLIRKDRVAFWDKCVSLSMQTTKEMLDLNRDHDHYSKVLKELGTCANPVCTEQ